MKIEKIPYSVGALNCEGVLVYDEAAKNLPLLLMAPNWAGVTEKSIESAVGMAKEGYVVFLVDMYGLTGRPTGQEAPMEFLQPFIRQPQVTRERINAALEAMTAAAKARGIGDASRRAAFGYCFGGSNVLDLARSGADVAAVVSFHGNLRTGLPAEPGAVKAKVLAVHGADDPVAPKGDRDALEEEMRKAGANWTILAFGGVFHSFTDPSANRPPSSQYSAHASRYGYALAHALLADAFAGKV